MKRAIFLILAVMMLTVTGCNREETLSGTYTDEAGATSYIFGDDGKVSMIYNGETTPRGEFEIKGNEVYIDGKLAGTVKRDTATLWGVEFTKGK